MTTKFDPQGNQLWLVLVGGQVVLDNAGNVYASDWHTTTKLDPQGNQLWSVLIGGQVVLDSTGNVYVSGWDSVAVQSVTAKLDPQGKQLWSLPISGGIVLDSAGNVYVFDGGATTKLNPQGNQLWSVPIGGQIVLDSAGNVYVLGGSGTTKLDPQGNQLWSLPIGGATLVLDSAGNVYVTDWGVTTKLDPQGNQLWSVPIGWQIVLDSAGNVYVTDWGATAKLDPEGNQLWSLPFGELTLVLDSAGNVYASGRDGIVKLDPQGNQLWSLPIGGQIVLDSAGNVYLASDYYHVWLSKYVQTGIDALSRNSIVAGGSAFALTVSGFGFSSGSVVQWNGTARTTTFVNSTELTAEISAADIASIADIATAEVTVTNRNGTMTPPTVFTIISANVGTHQSSVAVAGETVMVSTAPATEGQSGVAAVASNSGQVEPVVVTVANYSANPTSGTIFNAGGGYLDVQVTGADTSDVVESYFYYSSTISGVAEENLVLRYFNGSGWAPVLSSGGSQPLKDTRDNLEDTVSGEPTVSGGRFAVTFDATSTPQITQLSGTVFATADGTKPVIARVSGPSGPLPRGTAAQFTMDYMAPGGPETHRFNLAWGDGTTATLVPTVYGTLSTAHTYGAAGVYTVTVTLTDGNQESVTTKFEYVVVYDPDGGFVTGGGWINSPAGAYRVNTSLNGKASFGFNCQYHKGAAVPGGNTEFKLQCANFSFKITDYQWLVVAGAKAQYTGSGTINGAGDYGFLLTAIDGKQPGGGGFDKFRMKIWDKAADTIIYDNAYGSSDDLEDANPQVIAGGSIVIHKAK